MLTRSEDLNTLAPVRGDHHLVGVSGSTDSNRVLSASGGGETGILVFVTSSDGEVNASVDGPVYGFVQGQGFATAQ